MNAADRIVDEIRRAGVLTIFGNPGTTELPLVKSILDASPELHFVVGLSEIAAVGMADGYARVNRALSVVNLHAAPGLGNAIGALYSARTSHVPMLVIVGAQDTRHQHLWPLLHGDLESMARGVAKSVHVINHPWEVTFQTRHAIASAMSAPRGPAVLVCPLDTLDAEVEDAAGGGWSWVPTLGTLTGPQIDHLRDLLGAAKRIALLLDEEVYWSRAESAAKAFAAAIGADILVNGQAPCMPISKRSPRFRGFLPPNRSSIVSRLAPYDTLVISGAQGWRQTLFHEGKIRQKKIWLGTDMKLVDLGQSFDLMVHCDPRMAFETLAALDWPTSKPLLSAREGWRTRHDKALAAAQRDHPSRIVTRLLDAVGDAVVIDESSSMTTDIRVFCLGDPGGYFKSGSGTISWGIGALVGASVAASPRPVAGFIGDGSLMYASEAMWTASRERLDNVTLFVLANGRYQGLNNSAQAIYGQTVEWSVFDLGDPVINHEALAASFSWQYLQIANEKEAEAFELKPGRWLVRVEIDPTQAAVTFADHY